LCKKDGSIVKAKVDNVFMSHGVSKFEVQGGVAGDIVQLTGIASAQIGETIADADESRSLADYRSRSADATDLPRP
jgi:GTP-binding protein